MVTRVPERTGSVYCSLHAQQKSRAVTSTWFSNPTLLLLLLSAKDCTAPHLARSTGRGWLSPLVCAFLRYHPSGPSLAVSYVLAYFEGERGAQPHSWRHILRRRLAPVGKTMTEISESAMQKQSSKYQCRLNKQQPSHHRTNRRVLG